MIWIARSAAALFLRGMSLSPTGRGSGLPSLAVCGKKGVELLGDFRVRLLQGSEGSNVLLHKTLLLFAVSHDFLLLAIII